MNISIASVTGKKKMLNCRLMDHRRMCEYFVCEQKNDSVYRCCCCFFSISPLLLLSVCVSFIYIYIYMPLIRQLYRLTNVLDRNTKFLCICCLYNTRCVLFILYTYIDDTRRICILATYMNTFYVYIDMNRQSMQTAQRQTN